MNQTTDLTSFIWNNANDLRGDFQHTEFGRIILPFTVLRRLECVLEPTKADVIDAYNEFKGKGISMDILLPTKSQHPFYNTSNYNLATLGATQTLANLEDYLAHFSANVRVIFEKFDFYAIIEKLNNAKLLYRICDNFANLDLHPNVVPDRTMSNVYEHLIAKFGSEVGTGAEDFMTPKDVVHLATTLLLVPDNDLFANEKGIIRTLYDQTCGTGGFLTDMMNYIDTYTDRYQTTPVLVPHGQELTPATYAVALGNLLLKKVNGMGDLSKNIKLGSTLSEDFFAGKRFHYQCSNPPFGMTWKKDADAVQAEHKLGFKGRFGAGLPNIDDGSMLFLQNLVAKLETPDNGGGRGAIVLSGSPLFNGGAGSGPSEIRRWILENDYLEAIISLPTDIFFRTGIGTYIWLISNRKPEHRKGKVQLIDATGLGSSMRKNESKKSKYISEETMTKIAQIYTDFVENDISKIFDYTAFGYRQIKLNRPLRVDFVISPEKITALFARKELAKLKENDKTQLQAALNGLQAVENGENFAKMVANLPFKLTKAVKNVLFNHFAETNPNAEPLFINGEMQFDKALADEENIPLGQDIQTYLEKEVLPHSPDSVLDESYKDEKDGKIGVVGYEINFNRYFYQFEQPRHPDDILAEIRQLSAEVAKLLGEI
ncbi:class I SAM-dependent DNA methyltransferase [Pasteurellaceae bacterium LIM206]|nr:class I SAM-dependent DNA methyltransferase [Pasteurellaceae bacterium LIM206]